MRVADLARAVGIAAAVLSVAPLVAMGASPAHADSGAESYARCVGAEPPPPGVSPENWFPSVHIIEADFDSAIPAAEITQRLVTMGVAPKDAATRVQCFLAYAPR